MTSINQVLPNLSSGLSGTGFIFGSGTSAEAGYPMMPGLTRGIVSALKSEERSLVDEILQAESITYDAAAGTPNIEVIADLVVTRAITAGCSRSSALESKLRALITDAIVSVQSPVLDNHVRFLEALKRRAFGRPSCVYVFTTNYDCLFELAGAEAAVVIETGFVGAAERFFDQKRLTTSCGIGASGRFEEHPELTVRLVKLHGSISWFVRDGRIFERHPWAIPDDQRRVLILPRRRKVMETLQPPHDVLFRAASTALGGDCKYLASCGFSFGDTHINDTLLAPALSGGRLRLFALCEQETDGMAQLKGPAFLGGFQESMLTASGTTPGGTDCWKFSRFVDLIA